MLVLVLAAFLAVPVLLGLVPTADSTAARRRLIWCALAGLVLGLLASAFVLIGARDVPFGSRMLLPPLWGALLGVGLGVAGALLQRVIAARRGRGHDHDLRPNDR